jgi:hypothetical protein
MAAGFVTSERRLTRRVVVCGLGGDRAPWDLPASTFEARRWIHGGERSLYALAIAIAAIGWDVELRGRIVIRDLDRMVRAAGGRGPRVDLPPRRPTAEDLVIVPDGWTYPLAYARICLSPARLVMMLLAPPGLFGWPFQAGWARSDPTSARLEEMATREQFRAMETLGFELWSNNELLVDAARSADVACKWVGGGMPTPFPEPGNKTHDVALVEANRWAPLARAVAAKLNGVRVLRIPEVDNEELVRLLGQARVLIWPSRVEGHSRIQNEARAMGTVPVALPNPFAAGLSAEEGAVIVSSLEEMPIAIEQLLADPVKLGALSALGIRTARDQLDWDRFVARVGAALDEPERPDPGRSARGEFGRILESHMHLLHELETTRKQRDTVLSEFAAFRGQRSVRWAFWLAASLRRWTGIQRT